MVRKPMGWLALCALCALVAPGNAWAGDRRDAGGAAAAAQCDRVSGKAIWWLIPSPNDPIGRVLGPATGDLRGAVSAFLTSLGPQSDGSLRATSIETWALNSSDLIIFSGVATFVPQPNQPIGTVSDALSLTVVGGTGSYAGATGSLDVRGMGYAIFGPAAGPGNSFFEIKYNGTICRN
jgi:hypothetical protein